MDVRHVPTGLSQLQLCTESVGLPVESCYVTRFADYRKMSGLKKKSEPRKRHLKALGVGALKRDQRGKQLTAHSSCISTDTTHHLASASADP